MTTKSRITAGKEIIIKKLEILSPEQFHSQIEERISELEQALKTKQHAVKHTPSGLIRIVRQKNRLQFYKRSSAKDAQGTYMPLSQEKLARNMVQNDYDQKTLPVIEAEIGFLKKSWLNTKQKHPVAYTTTCPQHANRSSPR